MKTGETEAAATSRLAAEKAEDASLKEGQFLEDKKLLEAALKKYRQSKKTIPDELKAKQEIYTNKALQQLTSARVAAEKAAKAAKAANGGRGKGGKSHGR